MEILTIWQRFSWLFATCYCACAETAISELPVAVLTTPLDSATPISSKTGISRQSEYIICSFVCILQPQIRHISTSGLLDLVSSKVGHMFPYRRGQFPQNLKLNGPSVTEFLPIRYVTLWPWRLAFWPWTVVVNFSSRVLTFHQIWAS